MSQKENTTLWSENVIVVDAEYVDRVAFNLIVNFERMLGRKIPAADMARWMDCLALDGGFLRTIRRETFPWCSFMRKILKVSTTLFRHLSASWTARLSRTSSASLSFLRLP